MNKVIILGEGYVGVRLGSYLSNCGHKVISFKRRDIDYHAAEVLYETLLSIGVGSDDIVINCSGFTGRPNIDECESEKAKTLLYNTLAPINVNEVCLLIGCQYYHISSGCVYTGYEKHWCEDDKPNFGPILSETSFYSHTKWLFEEHSRDCAILRLRMPFDDDFNHRSYLTKIKNYDNLISCPNSKTYLQTLLEVIENLVSSGIPSKEIGRLNITNSNALDMHDVVSIMKIYGLENPNWTLIKPSDLDTVAPRSNCILSNDKLRSLLPKYAVMEESDAIHTCCKNYLKGESK